MIVECWQLWVSGIAHPWLLFQVAGFARGFVKPKSIPTDSLPAYIVALYARMSPLRWPVQAAILKNIAGGTPNSYVRREVRIQVQTVIIHVIPDQKKKSGLVTPVLSGKSSWEFCGNLGWSAAYQGCSSTPSMVVRSLRNCSELLLSRKLTA